MNQVNFKSNSTSSVIFRVKFQATEKKKGLEQVRVKPKLGFVSTQLDYTPRLSYENKHWVSWDEKKFKYKCL